MRLGDTPWRVRPAARPRLDRLERGAKVLAGEVAVDVHRRADARVPKDALHVGERDAGNRRHVEAVQQNAVLRLERKKQRLLMTIILVNQVF